MRSPKSFTLQPPWGWTLTGPQGELSLGTNKPSWSGLAWGRLSVSAGLTWHDEGGTVERQMERKPKKHSLSCAIDWACKQFRFGARRRNKSTQTNSFNYRKTACFFNRKSPFAFYSNRLKYIRWWFRCRVSLMRCTRENSLRLSKPRWIFMIPRDDVIGIF